MNVIFYYPKTQKEIQELQKKVASVHIQAVKDYIKQLPCPREQKLELIQSIKNTIQEKDGLAE